MTIARSGEVQSARIARTTLPDRTVGFCLSKNAKGLTFRNPNRVEGVVLVPFLVGSEKRNAEELFEKGEKFQEEGKLKEAKETFEEIRRNYAKVPFFSGGEGSTYGWEAGVRVGILTCRIARNGKEPVRKSEKELWADLSSAIQKIDRKGLIALLPCDFVTGQEGTDDGGTSTLSQMADEILQVAALVKGFDFAKAEFHPNYAGDPKRLLIVVRSKSDPSKEAWTKSFQMRQANEGWRLTSFAY
jgi:hypothetical protein